MASLPSFPSDSSARTPLAILAREYDEQQNKAMSLVLYIENHKYLIKPMAMQLGSRWKRGDFTLDWAIAYINRYTCCPAAKDYSLQHGGMHDSWRTLFPPAVRNRAAEELARRMVSEFRLGNFWE